MMLPPPLRPIVLTLVFVLVVLFPLVAANNSVADYPDDQPVFSSTEGDSGELNVTLTIGQAMYTSADGSLVQKVVGYNGFLGGPTLRVKPGDTLRITLENNLPEEPCDTNVRELWNTFHAISATNLHIHGLFVSEDTNPTHVKIHPGESHEYVIKIPEGHQGGTHWYHPHVAGATTIQAGGGAVGLLIVEDDEGDLPTVVADMPEINLRIQHLDFSYLQNSFVTSPRGGYLSSCNRFCVPEVNRGNCSVYFFEDGPDQGAYNTNIAPDRLPFGTLTVNGLEMPDIIITAGQWYRMRTLFVPTTTRTLEPSLAGCDFKLLAKDGVYIPIAPRDIHAAYMASGNRADFLVRCKDPGTYEFKSLMEGRDSSWKSFSLSRVMARIIVEEPAAGDLALTEIPKFNAARPCYLPDMRETTADESYYFIQSGLTPPLPDGEEYPEFRPSWTSQNISFAAMNAAGPLSPPDLERGGRSAYDFNLTLGTILDIDFFAPQVHPLHLHVFPFQIYTLPIFDGFTDFFQVGDFHDVLMLPIGDEYGKAVLRSHIGTYETDILVHCHMYTHSDGGMAMLGHTVGAAGTVSPRATNCYTGSTNRGYQLVLTESKPTPVASPTTTEEPSSSPTTSGALGQMPRYRDYANHYLWHVTTLYLVTHVVWNILH
mmetsp:Transcript_5813/g.11370  ORF Transcript_5813/g.11370 Transcript_5813/m.11370 type:complete len:655 (-) Transcript_5813:21-1985(-)|eukprot:scaffold2849_cov174-Amphora_coffeaeformis.AAC.14